MSRSFFWPLLVQILILMTCPSVDGSRWKNGSEPGDDPTFQVISQSGKDDRFSVFIKQLVEDALRTNTSLKIDVKATAPIQFGLRKCGVYALASTRNVTRARHVFTGKSLQNVKSIIERVCFEDKDPFNLDLVTHARHGTRISVNITKTAYTDPIHARSLLKSHWNDVEEMESQRIHFVLLPLSETKFPIQMHFFTRRAVRTTSKRLKMTSSSWQDVFYKLNRCRWTLKQRRLVEKTVFSKARNAQVRQLVEEQCDEEWIPDTINVILINRKNATVTGSIEFSAVDATEDVVYVDADLLTTSSSSSALPTSSETTTTVLPSNAMLSVLLPDVTFELDWKAIGYTIAAVGGLVFALFSVLLVFNSWHSGSYNVSRLERTNRRYTLIHA